MKKAITISSLLLGVVFLSGCGQQQASQLSSQSSEQSQTQNEEARLKVLAGDGELIKMSDKDKKDIADWVAKYKESKDTAFEKVDKDWNYEDPAGTWFAQKELGFNTVIKPVNIVEYLKPVDFKGKFDNGKNMPKSNELSLEQVKELFSFYIPNLNKLTNIINQYHPFRVPKSELDSKDSCIEIASMSTKLINNGDIGIGDISGYDGSCSMIVREAIAFINKEFSQIGNVSKGLSSESLIGGMGERIFPIISKIGEPNVVYEFIPLAQKGENTSYFSEIKHEEEYAGYSYAINKTLIAGQIRIKSTKFEKVDENYIRKTVKYIDFLNIDGNQSYPFITRSQKMDAGGSMRPELLGYINGKFAIVYQKR